jgi:hypothetical protein
MEYNKGIQTIECKIVESVQSTYSTLVCRDTFDGNFFMCTVFPNWEGYIPSKGDVGYIEVEFVEGGDNYWEKDSGTTRKYNYTMLIFKRFILKVETTENKEIIL